MENNTKFGSRLRELRTKASMTLRELAEKVGVNFTYLSKIENGTLPPPSQRVICQLAEVLNAERDELLILAGVIPTDIAEILKDHETLERLRQERDKKDESTITIQNKQEETIQPTGYAGKARDDNRTNISFFRIITAAFLTIIIGILLWFAAPVTDNALSANNVGVVYNNKGEYEKALESFNKAIELDSGFPLAYNNRGWAYLELGQYDNAIIDCTKAIELDPRLAFAYSNRGLAYIRLGQFEQAISDCTRAIELDPGLALAYSNRGQAYINIGKYEEAIADLDKAVELNPKLTK